LIAALKALRHLKAAGGFSAVIGMVRLRNEDRCALLIASLTMTLFFL